MHARGPRIFLYSGLQLALAIRNPSNSDPPRLMLKVCGRTLA